MTARSSVVFYLNGEKKEVSGREAMVNVADYLREHNYVGTKVVCAEGDCGACTVVLIEPEFKTLNACIYPLFLLDGSHIVTVEGLAEGDRLHPAQQAMVGCHGAQCGYCTPGFVCSMAYLAEKSLSEGKSINEKRARNYLTGNLCRCTGYEPIFQAACAMDLNQVQTLQSRYSSKASCAELAKVRTAALQIDAQDGRVFMPSELSEALKQLAGIQSRSSLEAESVVKLSPDQQAQVRLIAGATDLGVLRNKGKLKDHTFLSPIKINSLKQIEQNPTEIRVGAMVTLAQFEQWSEQNLAEPSRLLHIFASPQIKHVATVVGNALNASPIADTIPFLLVGGARFVVQAYIDGPADGKIISREIPIDEIYLGYKKLAIHPHEMVTHIILPKQDLQFKLYKVSLRKDLDISAVTMAVSYKLKNNKFSHIKFALGGVGPTVDRIAEVENLLLHKTPTLELLTRAGELAQGLVLPISDVRGSAQFRKTLVGNLLQKFYFEEFAP